MVCWLILYTYILHGQVIIEETKRFKIIEECHNGVDGYHNGRDKTASRVAAKYYWKGINKCYI